MDRNAQRTTGETLGTDQRPTEPGGADATQREQAASERDPATHDPSRPSQTTQEAGFGESPDAAYGQREGQAEEGEAGMSQADEDTEPVVTGG